MEKKKKRKSNILKKIPFVIVIFTIIFSMFTFVASADGQYGASGDNGGNGITTYSANNIVHGIPITLNMSQFMLSDYQDTMNNTVLVLDNFGTTRPSANSKYGYGSDVFYKHNLFAHSLYPNTQPYTNKAFVGSYYDSFSLSDGTPLPTEWYDDSINYVYTSMIIPQVMAGQMDQYVGSQDVSGLLYSSILGTNASRGPRENNAGLSSQPVFRFKGFLSTSLINNYVNGASSLPSELMTYCVVDGVDFVMPSLYATFKLMFNNHGLITYENVILELEGDETNGVMFWDEVNPRYDSYVINATSMAFYYREAYDLSVVGFNLDFDKLVKQVTQEFAGAIAITEFYVTFGATKDSYSGDYIPIEQYAESHGSMPYVGASILYEDTPPNGYQAHIDTIIQNLTNIGSSTLDEDAAPSILGWLGRTVGDIMDTDIFGFFSLGDILYIFIGLGATIAFLKIFAGG